MAFLCMHRQLYIRKTTPRDEAKSFGGERYIRGTLRASESELTLQRAIVCLEAEDRANPVWLILFPQLRSRNVLRSLLSRTLIVLAHPGGYPTQSWAISSRI